MRRKYCILAGDYMNSHGVFDCIDLGHIYLDFSPPIVLLRQYETFCIEENKRLYLREKDDDHSDMTLPLNWIPA